MIRLFDSNFVPIGIRTNSHIFDFHIFRLSSEGGEVIAFICNDGLHLQGLSGLLLAGLGIKPAREYLVEQQLLTPLSPPSQKRFVCEATCKISQDHLHRLHIDRI